MSLRPNETALIFPMSHPAHVPESVAKPFPGTFHAVPYPARDQTEGGILLRSHGTGWSQRTPEQMEHARRAYHVAEVEFRQELKAAQSERRITPGLRKRLQAFYDRCEHAARKLIALQENEQPGYGMNTRPDAWIVIAVGEGIPFQRGDRVMCAPYSGHRYEEFRGLPDFTVFGVEDDWRDVTILIWNPVEEIWEPLANWLTIYVQPVLVGERDVRTLQNRYHSYGVVAQAGPDASVGTGTVQMLHKDRMKAMPDDSRWFQSPIGPYPGNAVWVREVDSDGCRRVLAEVTQDAEPA